ncbi:MAG: flagellar biosynthesis protein FlhB [Cycloclasticus sp.]|nr:flagellar biosynthesis protein FlhB [Cycloclasticus sp.]MBG95533.1 flagellar biosynthesis protein FlhB [Cycloclasticus sp.]HAI97715.1 flagellar biosynthesis protein FlhB [Methylococcaceae bacterium]|tara:strand:+ start:1105 stop:2250 length:1146 start_codon:yes stop_codon:yes gene_type:complete
MANENGQEKTEEPTAKREQDARKKGDIARSKELNTVMVLIVGSFMIWLTGDQIIKGMWQVMEGAFKIERNELFDPLVTVNNLQLAMQEALVFVAPFLAAMVVAAIAGPISMGGWSFSAEAIAPKASKMNPIEGFKRMFAVRSLIELVKSLLKFGLILGIMALLVEIYLPEFIYLTRLPLVEALIRASDVMTVSFVILCCSLLIVVAIDVPFSLWEYKKKLKMTLQEVKDEMKQTEGRPEVKGKVRQLQQELSQGRMLEEVPKADVIVTNPTHFAVAIKYDEGGSGAPIVVAKGADFMAAQIRNIAVGKGITLVSAPPLARALFFTTEIDEEVPRGLYLAVAQVLAYVYQLRIAKEKRWRKPAAPGDIPIPEEYKKYSNKTY